jgi:hypothetical protein
MSLGEKAKISALTAQMRLSQQPRTVVTLGPRERMNVNAGLAKHEPDQTHGGM